MTSMPASRSARAITFAPRSWPSSPGLAMTTLSLRIKSTIYQVTKLLNDRNLLVLPPDAPKGVAHLADRRIGAHRIKYRRHRVLPRLRGVLDGIERPADGDGISGALQVVQFLELALA